MQRVSKTIASLGIALVAAIATPATGAIPRAPQDGQELEQQIKRAQEYIDQGEPEYALDVLENVIDADDSQWIAHYLKGMAHGQQGDEKAALESFLDADARQPGVPDVYFMAGIASFGVGDYETCWEQTILAHQAGRDMSKEIEQLREVADPPDDLEERINAPRVLVGPMDTSVTEQNGAMESALLQVRVQLGVVQQQVARALRDSPNFGLVRARQIADYMVVVNVADYGGAASSSLENRVGDVNTDSARRDGIRPGAGRNSLTGLIELVDAKTNDIAFSLPMTLTDITSIGDLARDLRRRVELLENWARENRES
ncbi:MAG TPA: hypothetical protein QGG47_07800 [Acidobacteriota bacterium]|nr:hypothetical protein [Acidobacteriota bacterium]